VIRRIAPLFFRAKVLSMIYILFLLASACCAIYSIAGTEQLTGILGALDLPLSLSIFAFVLFAFLSYEFFYMTKRFQLEESLRSTQNGCRRLLGAQGVWMLLLVLCFSLLMLTWCLALCVKYQAWRAEFIAHLLLNALLNFCLIPCCGVLIGMALALSVKRLNAFLILVLFTLLGSPLANGLGYVALESLRLNLYPFLNLFDLFPPNLNWKPVPAFGLSILPYRWELVGFWGLLALGVLCLKLFDRKTLPRRLGTAGGVALSLVCLILVLQPGSKLLLSSDNPKESIMADWEYYFVDHPAEEDRETDAKFAITQYDMELSIGNQLKATATITVNHQKLPEYLLTLYHGYRLKSVATQDGIALPFTQEGDYITVQNPERHTVKTLRLAYRGASALYYTNAQGVYLPGFFPYYPHSGHRPVFDRETQGIMRFVLQEPVLFRINIHSDKTIYSNLPATGGNTFAGMSTGATLLAGFYDTLTVDGVTVVYPYLNTGEFRPEKLTEFVQAHAGTQAMPSSVRTVFLTPDINDISPYTAYCAFSDHLALHQTLGIEESYPNQLASSKKRALDSAYRKYIENPEFIRKFAEDSRDPQATDPNSLTAVQALVDYLDYYGEEDGLARVAAYLQDDADSRHWREFIRQFDGKGAQ